MFHSFVVGSFSKLGNQLRSFKSFDRDAYRRNNHVMDQENKIDKNSNSISNHCAILVNNCQNVLKHAFYV